VCRQFVANVLMQIIERHMMRVIEDIADDELDVKQIAELMKTDEDVEVQKQKIKQELGTIGEAIGVLKPLLL
jgi:hypothetical protein